MGEKIRAPQFCSGSEGSIMELAGIEQNIGLFGFDCKSVSSFDYEEEIFFYGGDTILGLKSIIKLKHGTWKNYKYLVAAIYFISRIIHGLSVDVTPKKKTKNWIKAIMKDLICSTNNSLSSHPEYFNKLLQYTILPIPKKIELEFDVIMNEWKWL